jgi:hypothetical protein
MFLSDIIEKLFDDKSKKLKLSKFIEEITPEICRKYIKKFLEYSFPETKKELYRSYLINTANFLISIGLYELLNYNNYIKEDYLLYNILGYFSSIGISTFCYNVKKCKEMASKIIPYI